MEALVAATQGGDPLLHKCRRYQLGLAEVEGAPVLPQKDGGKMLSPACAWLCARPWAGS